MVKKEVNAVFCRLAAGELSDSGARLESGWEMSLPTGRIVSRERLQAEAAPLIVLGQSAIPDLFSWVMNQNLALRYVALYALQQISGETPSVPYFKPDATEECSRAIEVWQKWYKARTIDKSRTPRQTKRLRWTVQAVGAS